MKVKPTQPDKCLPPKYDCPRNNEGNTGRVKLLDAGGIWILCTGSRTFFRDVEEPTRPQPAEVKS
jgi:hypothetical protein